MRDLIDWGLMQILSRPVAAGDLDAIHARNDDGDLVGKGRWEFEPLSPEETRVSFWCEVRSNSLLMHIGFLLGGERGHNMVYQELLAALKEHTEK